VFKIVVGPYFKLIEKEVFKLKHFIKKIPVADRPQYLRDRFGFMDGDVGDDLENRLRIFITDYTSYEASFTKDIFEACEFQLYEYMTSLLPGGCHFMSLLRKYLTGTNKLIFNDLLVQLEACRMSGEMNTSLGNGFTNLMVFLFNMSESGISHYDCIFEGDDGLTTYYGPKLDASLYSRLGFIIKMVYLKSANTASFCGQVFDYETLTVITDPVKVLLNLAWVHTQYLTASDKVHKELLRARAMSLLALYPGCPIIQSVAVCYMRLTEGSRWRFGGESFWYVRTRAHMFGQGLNPRPVSPAARLLMQQVFGITERDQQSLERYFDSMSSISTIRHPVLARYCSTEAYQYNRQYVMRYGGDQALPENALLMPSRS
jgi:hypothetical protein